MSTPLVNTVNLTDDNKIVDENDQEVPVGTIVHCLGALFKVTNFGIKNFIEKIEDNTYFVNQKYFRQLNELAFTEQPNETTTPDTAPQKEGLLASVYRLVTEPFSMRMLKNVTTRHKKRKSSSSRMVHINEITDNLTSKAENSNTASLGVSSPSDSMQILTLNEMILFNTQCNKCISEEVQFYFHSYEDFVNCKDDRLKVIVSALNAANEGHYNDLRIKYPGFILEPLLVDINKLVQVIQCIYLAQVVKYLLGVSKKDEKEETKEIDASATGNKDSESVGLFLPKGKDQAGLFPPNSIPKNHNKTSEHLKDFDVDQSVEEINENGSYQLPDQHQQRC